jgi:hypothetical protein
MKAGRPAVRVTNHQSRSAAANESGTVTYREVREIRVGLCRDFRSIFLWLLMAGINKKTSQGNSCGAREQARSSTRTIQEAGPVR